MMAYRAASPIGKGPPGTPEAPARQNRIAPRSCRKVGAKHPRGSARMTTTESLERVDFLASMLVTAVEGGVNYWAEVRNYRWAFAEDGSGRLVSASVELRDAEADGVEWMPVTLDTVERGIDRIKKGGVSLARSLMAAILLGDLNPEYAGDIDSEAADCIIQVGLLGDIIYS